MVYGFLVRGGYLITFIPTEETSFHMSIYGAPVLSAYIYFTIMTSLP